MDNQTKIENKVEFACDLADQLLEFDGWGAEIIQDEDGNESYTEETQNRFNDYYSVIMEHIENAKN